MTIKQQGGIFGRNPTFNDVGASTVDTTDLYTNNISVGTDFQIEPVTLLRTTGNNANNPVIAVSAGAVDKYATIDVYRGSSSSQIGWTFNTMYGSLAEAFTVTPSGNIAFPSGQGIDFSATSGTGTSELFSDYEEGNWTPTLTSGPTLSAAVGRYTKIGNAVYVMAKITRNDATANSNAFELGGLPYTPDNSNPTSANGLGVAASYNGSSDRRVGIINSSNVNTVFIVKTGTAVNVTYDNFIADTRTAELKWFYYT